MVLVTGASQGVGQATAALLAGEGYQVFGTARKPFAGSAGGASSQAGRWEVPGMWGGTFGRRVGAVRRYLVAPRARLVESGESAGGDRRAGQCHTPGSKPG